MSAAKHWPGVQHSQFKTATRGKMNLRTCYTVYEYWYSLVPNKIFLMFPLFPKSVSSILVFPIPEYAFVPVLPVSQKFMHMFRWVPWNPWDSLIKNIWCKKAVFGNKRLFCFAFLTGSFKIAENLTDYWDCCSTPHPKTPKTIFEKPINEKSAQFYLDISHKIGIFPACLPERRESNFRSSIIPIWP